MGSALPNRRRAIDPRRGVEACAPRALRQSPSASASMGTSRSPALPGVPPARGEAAVDRRVGPEAKGAGVVGSARAVADGGARPLRLRRDHARGLAGRAGRPVHLIARGVSSVVCVVRCVSSPVWRWSGARPAARTTGISLVPSDPPQGRTGSLEPAPAIPAGGCGGVRPPRRGAGAGRSPCAGPRGRAWRGALPRRRRGGRPRTKHSAAAGGLLAAVPGGPSRRCGGVATRLMPGPPRFLRDDLSRIGACG